MGLAYRQLMQPVTASEVNKVKSDPKHRYTTSPLGYDVDKYAAGIVPLYYGNAVGWKRADGIHNMARFEKDAMASCTPSKGAALIAGLKRAIAISKKYAGVKGTVVVNNKLYTRKNIEQKKG